MRPDEPPHGHGSGYVVDCLHSARLALAAGSYETAVRTAIALGNDTDTTACVAGGLAGLRDGLHAIPALAPEDARTLASPYVDSADPVVAETARWVLGGDSGGHEHS